MYGDEGIRYILRCNPVRAREMRENREGKYEALCKKVEKANRYLGEHPRANGEKALERLRGCSRQSKMSDWIILTVQGREIQVLRDDEALMEIAKLDGCYILKTESMSGRFPLKLDGGSYINKATWVIISLVLAGPHYFTPMSRNL